LIAGWISGEDLKEPEAVSVRDWRDSLLSLEQATAASADKIRPMQSIRNEPGDSTAPLAWPRQACAPQFDLDPKTVLFIMKYL
jgi:hypothetical protein